MNKFETLTDKKLSELSSQETIMAVESSTNRHVYYGCSKSRDQDCKSGYIAEEELIQKLQVLQVLLDEIDLNEIGIKQKIKTEVERFKKFQRIVLKNREKIEIGDIDIRNYAKFILKDGTDAEKRELLSNFKSKIVLSNKIGFIF